MVAEQAPLVPEALLEPVVRRLRVLGDPVRLRLLNLLRTRGELSVQEMVDALGVRQPSVSKHLNQLAREGLVHRRREGVHVHYRLADPSLAGLFLLLCRSVEARVDGAIKQS
ncbi:ArsR/SmtB family transcription factor [Rhodothermus profundi]|uniref:Transcriptional regulator, ArsR family n=1 Tax=Rhodothermus profundi TaxID=633813 RepID=A0A1M6P4B4_9BACT|nr:metalloregulator ArsR/SmtB family transcription factor [Rhodothermus profundi]SHK02742.1 transcriptional regulator, ArsR family [Rhodothermus profundi]